MLLRVGPAGLDLPVAFSRPLPWAAIHRIRRLPRRRRFLEDRDWLVVDTAPGVMPAYRLAGPRRLELWHLRHGGLRLPVHALDAAPDTVVASIERYRPVARAVE